MPERDRRETDELMDLIRAGQAQVLDVLAKPPEEDKGTALLRYSAYIVPLVAAAIMFVTAVNTLKLELEHTNQALKELAAISKVHERFMHDSHLWHKEVQLTLRARGELLDDVIEEGLAIHKRMARAEFALQKLKEVD